MQKHSLLAALATVALSLATSYAACATSFVKPRETNRGLATAADAASADAAMNAIPNAHPYLETTGAATINQLKAMVGKGGSTRQLYDKLTVKVGWELRQPIGTYVADAGGFLTVARDCLRRVQSCTVLYKVTGDPKYLARAKQEMLAAAAMPNWYPAHFLGTAEMTRALAFGFDWLYSDLTTNERTLIANAIRDKGLAEGLKAWAVPFGQNTTLNNVWTNNIYNWNPVCNGGMILGALAIAKLEPAMVKEVLTAAHGSLGIFLAAQPSDGSSLEGGDYWSYQMEYLNSAFQALQTSTGNTMDFVSGQWLQNAGNWRAYMGVGDQAFNYGDTFSLAPSPGAMGLAKFTSNPDLAKFAYRQAQVSDIRTNDVLYADDSTIGGLAILPPSAVFPTSSTAFLKTSWDPNALSLSMKGGNNALQHNHLDLGTFVLNWGGVQWISQLGADNYGLPHYTDTQRGTIYRVGTQGQNTLLAGGISQDINAKASITWSNTSGNMPSAILDLTGSNKTTFSNWKRGALVNGGLYALIQDEWTTTKTTDVVWQMHTKAAVVLSGTTARLTLGGKTMTMKIITPGAAFTRGNCQPASPQAANPGFTKIEVKFSSTAWAPKTLAIVIAPGMAAPNVQVDSLLNWNKRNGV